MLYPLHVIPVENNVLCNGILEGHDAPLALGLITCIGVLLAHTHHNALVLGLPDSGEEHGSRDIISSRGQSGRASPGLDVPDPLPMMSMAISSPIVEEETVDGENKQRENAECGPAAASENCQVLFNWNHGHLVYCHYC